MAILTLRPEEDASGAGGPLPARGGLAVSIYADKGNLRADMANAAAAAGLRIAQTTGLGRSLEPGKQPALTELVFVDCPVIDDD